MADQDHAKPGGSQSGGSQSGGSGPVDKDANNPLHDPFAAGADLYNSGNKTGNPVKTGTPGVPENGEGSNIDKGTPVHGDDD